MNLTRSRRPLAAALVLAAGLVLGGWAAYDSFVEPYAAPAKAPDAAPDPASGARPEVLQLAELEPKYGVVIQPLRLTAAGHLLDLRYRVVDADKAAKLLPAGAKPLLIHDKTGVEMGTPSFPKVGSLRQTGAAPKEGKSYFVLFANPRGVASPGDAVTLVIGERRVDGLAVEGQANARR